jgi:MtN3 and saliva related transmembrane protein
MVLFEIFQFLGGLILCFGYIPQIKQIIKTKSVADLNFKAFGMIFLGVLFMELYAINLTYQGIGWMLVLTNSMRLIVSGAVCYLILKYKNKD